MTQRIGVDWFRLLWDLVQRGLKLSEVARRCDIAESTLKGYLRGSHPPHWRGETLVELWCVVCERSRRDVPMTSIAITPRIVRRHGFTPEAEACTQLERVWR